MATQNQAFAARLPLITDSIGPTVLSKLPAANRQSEFVRNPDWIVHRTPSGLPGELVKNIPVFTHYSLEEYQHRL